jgi:TolB-like protein
MAQPQARVNLIETGNKVVRTSCQMLPEIGREPTPEELGRSWRCHSINEGSVRKASGRVRIMAQLIEAEGGAHLCRSAQTY